MLTLTSPLSAPCMLGHTSLPFVHVSPCLAGSLFLLFFVCLSICLCFSLVSGVVERRASSKSWANSEPDINNWGGQEGREWLLQYSYVILTWLPATCPCTQYLWSLTDDWGCNAASSLSPLLLLLHLPFLLSVNFLIFHPYATSSFSTLPSLLLPPSPSLCHFFSSPSHLLPSLRRVWHAHGPNSIIDQIKEMLLNSLNRQKEHTHAPDTPRGYNHTHTPTYAHKEANRFTLHSTALQCAKEINTNHWLENRQTVSSDCALNFGPFPKCYITDRASPLLFTKYLSFLPLHLSRPQMLSLISHSIGNIAVNK